MFSKTNAAAVATDVRVSSSTNNFAEMKVYELWGGAPGAIVFNANAGAGGYLSGGTDSFTAVVQPNATNAMFVVAAYYPNTGGSPADSGFTFGNETAGAGGYFYNEYRLDQPPGSFTPQCGHAATLQGWSIAVAAYTFNPPTYGSIQRPALGRLAESGYVSAELYDVRLWF